MSNSLKKALVIFSSPRNDGYTNKLLQLFLSKIKNYDISIYNTYKNKVNPCISCNYCKNVTGCTFNDDFNKIESALKTIDLLIIATPVYNMNFPSPLKAILDRMQQYYSMSFFRNIKPPIKKSKNMVLLLTSGSLDDNITKNFMTNQLKMIGSIINAKLIGTILLDNTDRDVNISNIEESINYLAKKVN